MAAIDVTRMLAQSSRDKQTLTADPETAPTTAPTVGPMPGLRDSAHAASLLDIFDATVAANSARVALDADDGVLTYGELSEAANRVARGLRKQGVGPGERVGVYLESGSWRLYAGILGVLRAGAAYVPVDADDPPARAAEIFDGADVCGVLEGDLRLRRLREPRGLSRELAVDDDAWIIFTSGSTGRPKGVAVTHRSAAAFVAAEQRLWTVRADDRVLAGLSVSFDASCEEMWLAWGTGAALVPAPRAVVRSGADLGPWLVRRAITVISTVPTLAAMWDAHMLANVRLLIVGGEACPDELGWRLAEGREVWNTYGPTEATVVSTAAPIVPGEPVRIGWPLAGWEVAVVDDSGSPVPLGESGELVIGGVGLGRYTDAELDSVRYAPLPALGWARAYRSGDIVRETIDGFEFVGRRDDQVKVAGRRLELGEVEARLCAVHGVRAAAAALQKTASGNGVLVGYVVGDVEAADVRAVVAEELPDGLAPLVLVLDELPLARSGKLDRKALPWPPPDSVGPSDPRLRGTGAWLAERFIDQLGPLAVTAETDFFASGGSSLAAAKLVSVLRGRFPSVAVADVYEHRTLGALAEHLDGLGEAGAQTAPPLSPARSRWGAVQLCGVLGLMAFTAAQWLVAVLGYDQWEGVGPRVGWVPLIAGWLLVTSAPGRALIVVAARRVLLRGVRPGRYRLHGWLACRIWFVERLAELCRVDGLAGTPWAPRYARLCGDRVGHGARLGTLPPVSGLLSVGDGATLEGQVDVHGWWIEGAELVLGEICVGAGARVGTRCLLMGGAEIGAGAEIEPGSVVNGAIGAGERWSGSPARYVGRAGAAWPATAPSRSAHRRFWKAMYGAGLATQSALVLASAVPGVLVLVTLGVNLNSVSSIASASVIAAPLMTATFLISYALLVAAILRFVWPWLAPGTHADDGAVAWAFWFSEALMESTRTLLFPLYASLYIRPWLRLAGVRIGCGTEVSTVVGLSPLVSVGELSFLTDDVVLATARARGGWICVEPIVIGDRTFIGPGAILRSGTVLGDDCLVGVLSTPPQHSASGTSWLGVPALELPRVPDRPDPARTTAPPRRLIAARAAVELLRLLLPGSVSVILGTGVFVALEHMGSADGVVAMAAAAPLALALAGAGAVAFTIAAKWLIMGRYRPLERPLWSPFIWRDEIINTCQEQLARVWMLDMALATPMMSAYLRAMGADVGRDVWFETLAVTEFDLVTLGDGAVVNRAACLMTHLIHDRLMRTGPSSIGAGATLGPESAVLPDTKLHPACSVGGRSIVLRGEELPAGTRWHGAPVAALAARQAHTPGGVAEPVAALVSA